MDARQYRCFPIFDTDNHGYRFHKRRPQARKVIVQTPNTYTLNVTAPNQNQLAPTETLTGVAPTTFGGHDGKITGVTTAMEYKLSTATDYTTVTGTAITGLVAGTYNVRYAAKTGYNAGTAKDVVVAAGANADQLAPTGLAGVAPTSALNDGKVTGTTTAMEYKLASAADSAYVSCSATATTGLTAGDYVVRLAAKAGFNASPTTAVNVPAYVAPVNKTELTNAITSANTKHDAAQEGIKLGNFEAGSKETFKKAIGLAENVAKDANATQQQVNDAVTALATAVSTFQKGMVGHYVSEIKTANILLVGDYAFTLSPSNAEYNLSNFVRAAKTAKEDAGKYHVYYSVTDVKGGVIWYDIAAESTMKTPVTINEKALYQYMDMK